MAISSRSNHLITRSNIYRLQTLIFNSKRVNHTLAGDIEKSKSTEEVDSHSPSNSSTCNSDVHFDMSSWKVVDSRIHGIDRNKISLPSKIALNILREEGKKAYLVGGCVRDLLLGRIPKDFDVITNAELTKITKYYRRARVVGQRFPICQVFIKGSMVEVSSFETVAKDADGKETVFVSQGATGYNEEDFVRWRNCLRRDFTINSLFYDPSDNKIYDYANGMRDLKLGKVQTVISAHVSFKEDCARILRGLRIAARLGFSFSEETATAIQDLYMSILDLNKDRLMLEMDYMFSYGAAASSLSLLERFKILPLVLPFHAAYLSKQGCDQTARSSPMLFKLFSSMDKLIACDRPGTPSLWIGALAFHWALVKNPQDALVIWALSSVLYHGKWKKAVTFAREKSKMHVGFLPEIAKSCRTKSDKALAEDVENFVSEVISAINNLTGLAYISENKGRAVGRLFNGLLNDIESYHENRESFEIDYTLLKKSNCNETRFVLGKIIMDTMSSGVEQVEVVPSSHLKTRWKAIKHGSICKQWQVVENEKDDLQKFNKNYEEEKECSQKLNTDVVSPSQAPEVVKEEKGGLVSSNFVQERKKSKDEDGSHTRKGKKDVEEDKDPKKWNINSIPEAVTKGKSGLLSSLFVPQQETIKKKQNTNQEQEQQVKKRQKLSSLFK